MDRNLDRESGRYRKSRWDSYSSSRRIASVVHRRDGQGRSSNGTARPHPPCPSRSLEGRRSRNGSDFPRSSRGACAERRSRKPSPSQDPPRKYFRYRDDVPIMVDRATSPIPWYSCRVCGTTFRTKRNMQRHQQLVCEVKGKAPVVTCTICGIDMKRRDEMRRHYRRRHDIHLAAGAPLPSTSQREQAGSHSSARAPQQDRSSDGSSTPLVVERQQQGTEFRCVLNSVPAGKQMASASSSTGACVSASAGRMGGVPPEEAKEPQAPRRRWKASKGPSFGDMEILAAAPAKDIWADSGADTDSDWDEELDLNFDL